MFHGVANEHLTTASVTDLNAGFSRVHLNEFVSRIACFMALQMRYLTTASVTTNLNAGCSRISSEGVC